MLLFIMVEFEKGIGFIEKVFDLGDRVKDEFKLLEKGFVFRSERWDREYKIRKFELLVEMFVGELLREVLFR